MDYDSYRLNISSVWAKWDEENGMDIDSVRKNTVSEPDKDSKVDVISNDKWIKESSKNDTIQSFTGITPTIIDVDWSKNNLNSDNNEVVTWYSKMDILGIIGTYIENNLDDDTDILVTVEYEDDYNNPNKIVLQTQWKSIWKLHFVSIPRLSVKKVFGWLRNSKSKTVRIITWETEKIDTNIEIIQEKAIESEKQTVKSVTNNTYNGLTQNEIKEAEELFSILF